VCGRRPRKKRQRSSDEDEEGGDDGEESDVDMKNGKSGNKSRKNGRESSPVPDEEPEPVSKRAPRAAKVSVAFFI
jgi:hypothetical protein